MKRTISFKLSADSVGSARERLSDIKKELTDKLLILNEKLADIGAEVVRVHVNDAIGADDKNVDIDVQHDQNGDKVITTITVNGDNILFIEYGSGIRFNNGNFHPWAHKYGYGVGTYPGQTHAFDPNGWYYRKDGALHHSWGTKATMPVYNAYKTIQERITEVAKEVFNG